jgi:hypothetical protein
VHPKHLQRVRDRSDEQFSVEDLGDAHEFYFPP